MVHGSILQETIDIEEYEEVADLRKIVEKPEAIIEIEKVVVPSDEAISMTPRDDWLLANVYHDNSDNSKVEVPAEVTDVKRNTFIEVAEKFLDDYKEITSALFQKFRVVSNENFYFQSIKNYRLMLEGKKFLNARQKNLILGSVSKKLRLESEHLKLYRQNEPNEEIKRDLEDESAGIGKTTRDYFDDLVIVLEGKETDESELELICKNVEMSNFAKNILFNSLQTQNVEKQTKQKILGRNRKFQDNRFEFLRNRIKMLKNILIEENNVIQQLWEGATTLQKKMQLKKEIVQLYLKDSEIQASIEMLLFDFMTVLRSKELKQLWKKTTNLFSCINMRRVLFSDQPLLKSLGRLLEPYEITSELVEKMLNLISDEYVMDCMQQILKQSGNDFSDFMQIMNDEENKKFKNLRDKILEWNNWEEYALLIPSR
ncbi:hypothetical protein AVEN_74238-1 [Araneus ventricosus]|uniref:Uncharacterized protein n=1 Tax=Araneus ventricosus TaxID=182803 RepID=A0A4Y2EV99_ARAVE|nr:hypothetical protein AVEN_74238-1 [Araneus ventricosus]